MKIPVLDHGYIELIECWGTGKDGVEDPHDARHDYEVGIIEAARQSTQGSFRGWNKDMALLEYLNVHKHATPFEFAGIVIEVQAPIFVFREWHRHRTQSYNEMSARYTEIPEKYYVPSLSRLLAGGQATANKQASGAPIDKSGANLASAAIEGSSRDAFGTYHALLGHGVARELARLVLPVNTYSRMRASANLRNWLAFLTLRAAPSA